MTYRIGTLASETGVSADTIRHYERIGVLPRAARDANGYRRFPDAALLRIRVVQRALDAGFSLAELRRILQVRDAGGAPCRTVLGIAERRLRELDVRIESLQALRAELGHAVADWRRTLDTTAPGQRAGLLDAWARRRAPAEDRKTTHPRGRQARLNRSRPFQGGT